MTQRLSELEDAWTYFYDERARAEASEAIAERVDVRTYHRRRIVWTTLALDLINREIAALSIDRARNVGREAHVRFAEKRRALG